MWERLLGNPKVEHLLVEGAKKGIEKTVEWAKEKIDALDKPVAKEIPQNSTRLKESWNYIAELDKPITGEIKPQFSQEINSHISSPQEREIYIKAGLEEKIVNGKPALVKCNINPKQVDEFGMTNRERMKKGLSPIAPNGEVIELHHIGQKPDSPLSELTRYEHRGKGNDTILHNKTKESEIDRNAFQKERQEHWQHRIGAEIQ